MNRRRFLNPWQQSLSAAVIGYVVLFLPAILVAFVLILLPCEGFLCALGRAMTAVGICVTLGFIALISSGTGWGCVGGSCR